VHTAYTFIDDNTMNTTVASAVSSIDVRDIEPRERHATLFSAFRAMSPGNALEVTADHDLKPLYHQFQTQAPGNFAWTHLEFGPDIWRVSIQKLSRDHGAGECCGMCGGRA
jgi:uncharacterized protein (DUF2249 family)